MKIGSLQMNNPLLQYQLDPGEPGLAYPARASDSIGRVASHELGNIRRFRQEAAENGGIVVSEHIYLNLEYAGSFLAATSGFSEARIIYPKGKTGDKAIEPIIKAPGDNPQIAGNAVVDGKPLENGEVDPAVRSTGDASAKDKVKETNGDGKELDRLKEQEKELSAKQERLSSEKLSNAGQTPEDARDEELKTKADLDRVKARIAYLDLKKSTEKQNDLLVQVANQAGLAYKLIGMKYGATPTGHAFDTWA
jgi:hypothetical protein